jgi:hypothetical protein
MDQILLKIENWQTLIGIGLGAVISVTGYWFQNWLANRSEKKENLRKIEIYTAQTINDLNDLLMTLRKFIVSIEKM